MPYTQPFTQPVPPTQGLQEPLTQRDEDGGAGSRERSRSPRGILEASQASTASQQEVEGVRRKQTREEFVRQMDNHVEEARKHKAAPRRG